MATILLVNFDQEYGPRLAGALRDSGHRTLMADSKNVLSASTEERQIDIMLLDLTHIKSDPWSDLRCLSHRCKANGLPVPILCYSKIYRGPSFELRVERFGARLVYAR